MQRGAGSILLTPLQHVVDRSLLTYAMLTHALCCLQVAAVTICGSAGICICPLLMPMLVVSQSMGGGRDSDTHVLPYQACAELLCQRLAAGCPWPAIQAQTRSGRRRASKWQTDRVISAEFNGARSCQTRVWGLWLSFQACHFWSPCSLGPPLVLGSPGTSVTPCRVALLP